MVATGKKRDDPSAIFQAAARTLAARYVHPCHISVEIIASLYSTLNFALTLALIPFCIHVTWYYHHCYIEPPHIAP